MSIQSDLWKLVKHHRMFQCRPPSSSLESPRVSVCVECLSWRNCTNGAHSGTTSKVWLAGRCPEWWPLRDAQHAAGFRHHSKWASPASLRGLSFLSPSCKRFRVVSGRAGLGWACHPLVVRSWSSAALIEWSDSVHWGRSALGGH